MKFEVTDKQYDQLVQTKNYMMMDENGHLFAITDFTVDKIEEDTGVFKKKMKTRIYITAITIKAYNSAGHFLGTYNEKDCLRILEHYTSPYLDISFYTPRNKFIQLMDALKAFGFDITKKEESFVDNLMRCLKSDPNASDYHKNYEKTEQYLQELIEKDESVLKGLITAMEQHLEK
jgi:hypothetical protein